MAEWLSRVPAKYMGFPARVRISQAPLFFLFFIFFTGEREIFFFFFLTLGRKSILFNFCFIIGGKSISFKTHIVEYSIFQKEKGRDLGF